jgi:hypothetical protein
MVFDLPLVLDNLIDLDFVVLELYFLLEVIQTDFILEQPVSMRFPILIHIPLQQANWYHIIVPIFFNLLAGGDFVISELPSNVLHLFLLKLI